MPFPPPTDGFVEKPVGDDIVEYLMPKPGVTHPYSLEDDYPPLHLEKGDVLILEFGRNPHNRCHALIEQSGERMVVQLHWHNRQWFAISADGRKGRVTEEMLLIGVARHSIKSQIDL
ncbi:hypothetical protein LRP52_37410 [Photobacterium sp. ZSDE20]|uniref:Peptidase S24/S26A/S26B/S26C domain-containing protein n=1 Tax=Photobacterium pectinilyticum TaxID=2906793 RepID=A0ABT1N0U4_9GAMM|nr:hypothetical protein [Photobacterium sp. ZSDE20]MCQ1058356.1 hypothetical protein [Photobacterium sp. ZSDE20]MDD1827867.1 hypothetical protein [Photobacterium sp. ZSDE20]